MLTGNNDFLNYGNAFPSFTPDDPEKKRKGADNEAFKVTEPLPQPVLRNSATSNYMQISRNWARGEGAPEDTLEERDNMRRNYSTTDRAFNDVAGDYYRNVLVSNFRRNRSATKEKAQKVYRSYMSVVGADPELAMREMLRVDRPVDDLDKAMKSVDLNELRRLAEPVALYAGYDTDDYVNDFIIPSMRNRLIDELVQENVPKSPVEYVIRSSLDNSLAGKVAKLGMKMSLDDDTSLQLASEGLRAYDANLVERIAGNVGGLLVDTPVFGLMGSSSSKLVGKATSIASDRLAKKVLAMKGGEVMTQEAANAIARRAITSKLVNRMAQNASVQGLTLGSYDVANSVVDDLLAGEGVDAGKAAGAFFKGAATGVALGAIGTPLREAAKRQKSFCKGAASVGVLGVESAIFTGATELEKMAHGIEVTPVDLFTDYAESAATLGVMRMANWRPSGQKMKLEKSGRIKPEFDLSSSEREELSEMNVNPDVFMYMIQRMLKLPSFNGRGADSIIDCYARIMANENVSASAKSKLMFLVENKMTSTPPVPVDYLVEKDNAGKWSITYFDATGRKISCERYDNAGNVKSRMIVQSARIRRNRILSSEMELTDGVQSQNFLRQAGLYAEKNNVDLNFLAEAMYKKVTGEKLLPEEAKLVDAVLESAAYDDAGMVQYLYDVRRMLEKKYGLEKGTLTTSLNEDFYRVSKNQNLALDEYESVLRGEVEKLKNGTSNSRSRRMLSQGLNSGFFGMTNDEVKAKEIADHEAWVAVRDADRVGLTEKPKPFKGMTERRITVPDDDNSGYVWSYNGVKNTKADIELYKERAQELGDKFGLKLNFITDEHEVELPSSAHPAEVERYNMNIRAEGWMNNGKVYINLPNVRSVEHAEKVVLHEVVAHRGLLAVFGDNLYEFLEDVYKKASPEVIKGIREIKGKYSFADNYTVVEEYLAYLAEKVNPTPKERSIYVRIKNYIRNLLVRMNLYTGSNRTVSEKELTDIMQRHCEYMMKRTRPADYRKDVFGTFKAAHADESTYYNYDNYLNGLVKRAESGELFSSTPKFFRDVKGELYYEHFPKKVQERVRGWLGKSDEEMNARFGEGRYMVPEEKPDIKLPGGSQHSLREDRERTPEYIPYGRTSLSRDPFYRLLKVHSPLDAMEYSELFKTPVEEWNDSNRKTWDRLSRIASDSGTTLALADVVDSHELFREYPVLRSMPVQITEDGNPPVSFDSRNNRFVVNRKVFLFPNPKAFFETSIADAKSYYGRAATAVGQDLADLNVRLVKRYNDATGLARKMRMAKEYIPDFDADGKISEEFKRSYGFMPEEFIERFPEVDDYFLYRLSDGLGKVNRKGGEANAEKVAEAFRRFFIGPFEVILEAGEASKGNGNVGPLRMKEKHEQYESAGKTELEQAEADALTRDYLDWEQENGPDAREKYPLWWVDFLEQNDEKRAIQRYMREYKRLHRMFGGKDEDFLN